MHHLTRAVTSALLVAAAAPMAHAADFTATLGASATAGPSASVVVSATFGAVAATTGAGAFTTADLTVTGGSVSGLTMLSGTRAQFTLTASLQGTATVRINAGSVSSTTGADVNAVSNTLSYIYDSVKPNPVISTVSSSTAYGTAVPLTIQWSEAVSNFTVSDLVLTNATVASFVAVDADTYTVLASGVAAGSFSVALPANVATDLAGNLSNGASTFTKVWDVTGPTGAITSTALANTRTSPIPFTITWSEAVNGFTVSDLAIVNGTTSALVTSNNTTFTCSVIPTGEGLVSLSVPASAARDIAGNYAGAAATYSRTYDITPATAALSVEGGTPANGSLTRSSTIGVLVAFSEAINVSTLSSADFTLVNGTVGAPTLVSGTTYKLVLTPAAITATATAGATVSIALNAGGVQDLATNTNLAPVSGLSWTVDRSSPSVTLGSTAASTVAGAFVVSATFSEPVTGLLVGDFSVTGGAASNLVLLSSTRAQVTITPSAATVTVGFPAAGCTDLAGNPNTVATNLSRTYNSTALTGVLTSTAPNPTRTSPIPFSLTWSQGVTGFDATDLTVVNGTVAGFTATSSTAYGILISPTDQGVVSVSVAATRCATPGGTSNSPVAAVSRTYDSVVPTATLSVASGTPPNGSLTNAATLAIQVSFSEATATGSFAITDLQVVNAVAGSPTLSGTNQYRVVLTPAASAASIAGGVPVSVFVKAGSVTDLAGNAIPQSNSRSWTVDTGRPTVVLGSTSSTTVASAFTVSATFSEVISTFSLAQDLTIVGASASGLVTVTPGRVYSFTVTPSSVNVSLSVKANAVVDAANNGNTASGTLSRTYNSTALTGVLTSSAPARTKTATIPFSITWNAPVTGFVAGDLTVSSGTVTGFSTTDNRTFTFKVVMSAQGSATVSVAAGRCSNAGGTTNQAVAAVSRFYDSAKPGITLAVATGTAANGASSTSATLAILATFTEAIDTSSFGAGDISATNAAVGTPTLVGTNQYRIVLTPTGAAATTAAGATVSVSIAAGKVLDVAGNTNTASNSLAWAVDIVRPSLVLSSTTGTVVSGAFPVSIALSETVSGFVLSDITVLNGTASALAGSGLSRTFTVTPATTGTVTVKINANVCQDAKGNKNVASANLVRTYDNVRPTVNLTTTAPNVTKAATFSVTASFSENVTGFASADISVTNGTKSNFTAVNAKTYTVVITPSASTADVTVTVQVAAGVCTDIESNPNFASTALTRISDRNGPASVLTSSAVVSSTASITATVTFSEPVTGLTLSDFVFGNATGVSTQLIGVTNTQFRITFRPTTVAPVTIDLPAGRCIDAPGNGNQAAIQLVVPTGGPG